MAKKKAARPTKKPAVRRAPQKLPPGPSSADQLPEVCAEDAQEAGDQFVQGLVKRGEAVPAGQPLPSGATHVIVGQDAKGNPIVKRKRFSLF